MKSYSNKSGNTTAHLFKVGQTVQKKITSRSDRGAFYQITGTLPPKEGSPQYRIQNHYEDHERVITQDLVELVVASSINKDETDIGLTLIRSIKLTAESRRRKALLPGTLL